MEKKTNKAKLDNFVFLKISALSQGPPMLIIGYRAFDNIGGNYALPANSTKICLLVYFCMQNSYLR